MTVISDFYTVGNLQLIGNQPINHARILWDFKTGTATGDGFNPELAANDYTAQRWDSQGGGEWVFTFDEVQEVDTFVISGHNLRGVDVSIEISPDDVEPFEEIAAFTVPDNDTLFVMANEFRGLRTGLPHLVKRYKVIVTARAIIAIIRAGKALQMKIPLYGGHGPVTWNRATEGQQSFSETGQWLGRTEKRLAYSTSYTWDLLPARWYLDNFEPFARTLPLKPFAIAGNPRAMPWDAAWCWAQGDPAPSNMGLRDFVEVSMPVTGFAG